VLRTVAALRGMPFHSGRRFARPLAGNDTPETLNVSRHALMRKGIRVDVLWYWVL